MPLLLENIHAIHTHWELFRNSVESVLPRENGTAFIDTGGASSPIVALRCRNYPDEIAERFGGRVVSVVPLLNDQPQDRPWFWLGWYEEWNVPERVKRAGKRLQFRSSALTVYAGAKGSKKQQLLRAEWAGPTEEVGDRYIFQSDGSAHPHWHVDGIRGYLDDVRRSWSHFVEERGAARDLARERVRDFGDEHAERDIADLFNAPAISLPGPGDLAWTEVHLAASARWAERPWLGPDGSHETHASNPASCEQIRDWLLSCIRYLQAEIEDKLLRARY